MKKYCTIISMSINLDLLKELDDFVEELRKDETLIPRPKNGNQPLSRSEIICECVRKHIVEWRRLREKQKKEPRYQPPPLPIPDYLLRYL